MAEIKELENVESIEVDKEDGKMFIEAEDSGGVEIDLNILELMTVLGRFTEETWGNKEIHGIPDEPPLK